MLGWGSGGLGGEGIWFGGGGGVQWFKMFTQVYRLHNPEREMDSPHQRLSGGQ